MIEWRYDQKFPKDGTRFLAWVRDDADIIGEAGPCICERVTHRNEAMYDFGDPDMYCRANDIRAWCPLNAPEESQP